jgi:hypothetical protein
MYFCEVAAGGFRDEGEGEGALDGVAEPEPGAGLVVRA